MTKRKTPAFQRNLSQDECLYLAERLKKASMTNEKEFDECVSLLMKSPEKLEPVLEELELDAELLLSRAIEHAKAEEIGGAEASLANALLHRAREGRPPWKLRSMNIGAFLATVLGATFNNLYVSGEIAPTIAGDRIQLPDRSVVATDPHTRAHVDYTRSARNVDLRLGGANFEVSERERPFNVNTPVGTATALGTRFYVGLEGSAQAPEALVRVRLGRVRISPRSTTQKPVTLEANQQVQFGLDGPINVVPVPASDIREYKNEPLVRVAAGFNQRSAGRRLVIQGRACSYPFTGTIDLEDASQFIKDLSHESKLKTYDGDEVVYVRVAADPSPVGGAVQNRCDVMLDDAPAVTPTASHGTSGAGSPRQSEDGEASRS